MKAVSLLAVIAVGFVVASTDNEPQCACSKFPYEKQLLEKMVRMEFAVEKMKNEMEDAKQSVQKTLEEFHEIKEGQDEKIEKISKHLKGNIPPSFTARLSSHLTKLGNNQPIVFDNILTNIGAAYSGSTGVFTAPKNGVYFFIATVMSYSNQLMQTEIVKNGQSMVKMYSYDKSHEQGTSGVVIRLDKSDEVWVRHINTVGENVYGYNWSTFSGFQISD